MTDRINRNLQDLCPQIEHLTNGDLLTVFLPTTGGKVKVRVCDGIFWKCLELKGWKNHFRIGELTRAKLSIVWARRYQYDITSCFYRTMRFSTTNVFLVLSLLDWSAPQPKFYIKFWNTIQGSKDSTLSLRCTTRTTGATLQFIVWMQRGCWASPLWDLLN